jgi:hypothetical protein
MALTARRFLFTPIAAASSSAELSGHAAVSAVVDGRMSRTILTAAVVPVGRVARHRR